MAKKETYDLCIAHLYDDVSKLQHLAPQQLERLKRIRSAYTIMLDFPNKKDRDIILHLEKMFSIERSTAYEDLRIIKDLLGSINRQTKNWHLFKFNNMIMKAYERAEAKDNEDGMTKAADKYAKYNQLDKEEAQRMPWDEIKPQLFEPTSDPSVLGIKPLPNYRETIAALKKKYLHDVAEDITYEEIDLTNMEYARTGEI